MSENWKPGDVAMVNDCTRPDAPWKLATCTAARTPERETTWRLHDTGGEVWGSVSDARRLMVIDPEDREQVERLARESHDAIHKAGDFDALTRMSRDVLTDLMQAALREFANPTPLIEEPTGLGAVVEAINGNHFVRIDLGHKAWRRQGDFDATNTCEWHDIDVVRVLSEGYDGGAA